MSQQTIWQNVLDHVRKRVSEVEFQTWFERIKPLGVREGVLELGVPTSFAGDWISKHYAPLIQESLARLGAEAPRFELRVLPGAPVQQDIFALVPKNGADERPAPRLNPKYTFENFVVGENNSMAHAAALAVAKSPSKAYNPLFIYGGVGLGKTHLMHAVGQSVAASSAGLRIEYVSTETFTNELITSIREDRMAAFRERYRSVDLLLVDDIQFIAGKERTQEEFFHTFNALYESHKQIVLSSDRPPKDILTLSSRLRSRFEWGLITDIQPPELETRIAILRMNADYRGVKIPEEALEYIAGLVTSNVRELEGSLVRVVAYASLNGVAINRQVATKALSDVFSSRVHAASPEDILALVSKHFNLSPEDLKGSGRRKEVVLPRQIAMYLIREIARCSFPEIGQFFQGRDHTTVLHSTQKIQDLLGKDPEVSRVVALLRSRIG